MFRLVNKFGNVHKHVKDARKRDELIAAGYKLVEEPVEGERGVEDVAPYDGPQDAAHVEGAEVADDLSANAADGVEGESDNAAVAATPHPSPSAPPSPRGEGFF